MEEAPQDPENPPQPPALKALAVSSGLVFVLAVLVLALFSLWPPQSALGAGLRAALPVAGLVGLGSALWRERVQEIFVGGAVLALVFFGLGFSGWFILTAL